RDCQTMYNRQQPRYLAIISRRLAPLNEKWGKSSYHQSGLVLEIPPHNHLAENRWQQHHGLPYDAFLVHAELGVYFVQTK
ncbi:MAG: hypothetical protein J6V72_06515, partial [Kiritimatiellae bacterium]|nr:hypothetical protein [Kiritimatiellia bacterium]